MSTGKTPPAAAGQSVDYTANLWRALWYFALYRVTIAALLLALGGLRHWPASLLGIDPRLGLWSAAGYLLGAVGILLAVRRRLGRFVLLRNLQVPIDVMALTLFLHASGGVAGGFGILQVVATAGACLLASQRVAVAYASLATLALLAETLYGIFRLDYLAASYTHAGLLGLSCFVTGQLAAFMGEQVRGSAALVAEREAELRSLERLNEYVVQRMQAGILVLDEDLRVVLANQAALRMTGHRGALEGLPLPEISGMLNLAWRAWRTRGGAHERYREERTDDWPSRCRAGRGVRLSPVAGRIPRGTRGATGPAGDRAQAGGRHR